MDLTAVQQGAKAGLCNEIFEIDMREAISVTFGRNNPPSVMRPLIKMARFGRIKEASVELAPLTILVGKNNTGKSYMASLLWLIRSSTWGITPGSKLTMPAPDWFSEYVATAHSTNAGPLEISAGRVLPYVNAWLHQNRNEIVSDLLSLETATIGQLELQFEGSIWLWPRSKGPSWADEEFLDTNINHWAFSWSDQPKLDDHGGMITSSKPNVSSNLFGMAINKLIARSMYAFGNDAAYIPAARTGLVLAIKELAASVMGSFGLNRENDSLGRFSKPTISFLRSLVRNTGIKDSRRTKSAEVADFLQASVMSGQIEVSGQGFPTFLYQPAGSDAKLPMHAVSSMITELAPILSILRGRFFDGSVIIEEPEAHLHLSAQRCMARALVKLTNSGIPVVVTTHSDTFIQQINLLIQISTHPNRDEIIKKLGYSEDEIINSDDIAAYEFLPEGNGTIVRAAEKTSNGIVVSSLNDTLIELAGDVLSLAES